MNNQDYYEALNKSLIDGKRLSEEHENIIEEREKLNKEICDTELSDVFDVLKKIKANMIDYNRDDFLNDDKRKSLGQFLCEVLKIKGNDMTTFRFNSNGNDRELILYRKDFWNKYSWSDRKSRIDGTRLIQYHLSSDSFRDKLLTYDLSEENKQAIIDIFTFFNLIKEKMDRTISYSIDINQKIDLVVHRYGMSYGKIDTDFHTLSFDTNYIRFEGNNNSIAHDLANSEFEEEMTLLMLKNKELVIKFVNDSLEKYKQDNTELCRLEKRFNEIIMPYMALKEL